MTVYTDTTEANVKILVGEQGIQAYVQDMENAQTLDVYAKEITLELYATHASIDTITILDVWHVTLVGVLCSNARNVTWVEMKHMIV